MNETSPSGMIEISIRGFSLGEYASLLPETGRLSIPSGTTAGDILNRFGLSQGLRDALILFVNGRPKKPDIVLQANDTLIIFPPLDGG